MSHISKILYEYTKWLNPYRARAHEEMSGNGKPPIQPSDDTMWQAFELTISRPWMRYIDPLYLQALNSIYGSIRLLDPTTKEFENNWDFLNTLKFAGSFGGSEIDISESAFWDVVMIGYQEYPTAYYNSLPGSYQARFINVHYVSSEPYINPYTGLPFVWMGQADVTAKTGIDVPLIIKPVSYCLNPKNAVDKYTHHFTQFDGIYADDGFQPTKYAVYQDKNIPNLLQFN